MTNTNYTDDANDTDDAATHDLSSTGTIVEVNATNASDIGYVIQATGEVDYDVDIFAINVGWLTVRTYTAASDDTTDIDDGFVAPEAEKVRIRNTSTAAETADVMLGASG